MSYTVDSSKATRFCSQIDIDGKTIDPESTAWNEELIRLVTTQWNPSRDLVGYTSNFNSVDGESQKAIARDIKKLVAGYILIFIFSHIMLFKNSPVFSKAHLATGSIISVLMSIVTAFGLAQIFGVKFNLVVQTLPFILLGLGMDDTFVIMGAYGSTNIDHSIEDRMAATMAHAVRLYKILLYSQFPSNVEDGLVSEHIIVMNYLLCENCNAQNVSLTTHNIALFKLQFVVKHVATYIKRFHLRLSAGFINSCHVCDRRNGFCCWYIYSIASPSCICHLRFLGHCI